jgi:predicted nucleic-acid-binding protein
MRALDTHVLVRFFIDDPDDAEAERQRSVAIAALCDRAFVPVTVLLEFDWVIPGITDWRINRGFRTGVPLERTVR